MGKVGDTRAGVHGNVLLRRLDAFRRGLPPGHLREACVVSGRNARVLGVLSRHGHPVAPPRPATSTRAPTSSGPSPSAASLWFAAATSTSMT